MVPAPDRLARVRRRDLFALPALGLSAAPILTVQADSSNPASLASYYERHGALVRGAAFGWVGRGAPARLPFSGVRQVAVSDDAWLMLLERGGELFAAGGAAADPAGQPPRLLMRGVARFAAGQSGWFAIDGSAALWYSPRAGGSPAAAPDARAPQPTKIADGVLDACIGDSADYYIARDGSLFVKGLAHRGQYGDGKLTATTAFVATAADAVAVRAHTGHAIYLRRDGVVLGTGGNRFGPLSGHGLGDKADRWGPIFEGATAIATGSRHSAALRGDGSLWAWGEGFHIRPRPLRDGIAAVAAGDTATLALDAQGRLWQWERGSGPHEVKLAA